MVLLASLYLLSLLFSGSMSSPVPFCSFLISMCPLLTLQELSPRIKYFLLDLSLLCAKMITIHYATLLLTGRYHWDCNKIASNLNMTLACCTEDFDKRKYWKKSFQFTNLCWNFEKKKCGYLLKLLYQLCCIVVINIKMENINIFTSRCRIAQTFRM